MRLLIDEMHSPEIAEQLRHLGRDVISAQERLDLKSTPDSEIFQLMQREQRVIVTNNHRHFAAFASAALQAGETFRGLVFTSDRSLPRTKRTIPVMVELLDQLLQRYRHDETLPLGIEWLTSKRQ